MPEWKHADLTSAARARGAQGRPYPYITRMGTIVDRVVFTGDDSHIHELRLEEGQSWKAADLTNQAGAADATPDPFAYVTPFEVNPTARVIYRGRDSHVHELRLEPGGTWIKADLSHLSGAPDAAGRPFAYITEFGGTAVARVIYRGNDLHIHEVRLEDGQWRKADLSAQANAPAAGGDPVAYITNFDSTPTARLVYRGQDGHIHEIRLQPGSNWQHADLTHQAGAADAAGDPFAYITPDGPTARVVFRSTDAHIRELRLQPGGTWQHADLSTQAGAPHADGSPWCYITQFGNAVPRVLYRGQDSHIHELRLEQGNPWSHADLTEAAGAADANGDPVAYCTGAGAAPVARVLYRGHGTHTLELRLESGS